LVPMSPKGLAHEVLKTAVADRWYRLPRGDVDLVVATTFRLSEDTYLEPDDVIYPRASGIPGLTAANALLVVEVANLRCATTSAARRRSTPASAFASSGSSMRFG
jgi:hypothetical protein